MTRTQAMTSPRITWWAAIGIGALAVGGLQLLPSSASAATGVQRGDTVTSVATVTAKTVVAYCPTGTLPVGAVANTGGAVGVHLDRVWPTRAAVSVHATPFPSVTSPWALTVTPICVPRTDDIQYVAGALGHALRDTDDGQRYGANSDAECPAGKELIGAGGRAVSGRLDFIKPLGPGTWYANEPPDSTTVHGVEVNGKAYADGGTDTVVQAVAVCANSGHGSVVASTENLGTTDVRQTGKVCPNTTTLRAIGFWAMYPNHYEDNTPFSFATLRSMGASANLRTGLVSSERHQDDILTERWDLVGYFLCAAS